MKPFLILALAGLLAGCAVDSMPDKGPLRIYLGKMTAADEYRFTVNVSFVNIENVTIERIQAGSSLGLGVPGELARVGDRPINVAYPSSTSSQISGTLFLQNASLTPLENRTLELRFDTSPEKLQPGEMYDLAFHVGIRARGHEWEWTHESDCFNSTATIHCGFSKLPLGAGPIGEVHWSWYDH